MHQCVMSRALTFPHRRPAPPVVFKSVPAPDRGRRVRGPERLRSKSSHVSKCDCVVRFIRDIYRPRACGVSCEHCLYALLYVRFRRRTLLLQNDSPGAGWSLKKSSPAEFSLAFVTTEEAADNLARTSFLRMIAVLKIAPFRRIDIGRESLRASNFKIRTGDTRERERI